MTTTFLFLLLVFTVHRVTRLVTTDDFPFGEVRTWLNWKHGEAWITALVTCPHCASLWLSAALVAVTDRLLHPLPYPLYWFGAVAGAVSILFSITTRLDD